MATFVKTKILRQREWQDSRPIDTWINAAQILRFKPIGEVENADFTEIEFANGEGISECDCCTSERSARPRALKYPTTARARARTKEERCLRWTSVFNGLAANKPHRSLDLAGSLSTCFYTR